MVYVRVNGVCVCNYGVCNYGVCMLSCSLLDIYVYLYYIFPLARKNSHGRLPEYNNQSINHKSSSNGD